VTVGNINRQPYTAEQQSAEIENKRIISEKAKNTKYQAATTMQKVISKTPEIKKLKAKHSAHKTQKQQ